MPTRDHAAALIDLRANQVKQLRNAWKHREPHTRDFCSMAWSYSAGEIIAIIARIRALDALRTKNTELNRRCQAAESVAKQTIERARRAGGSFGRSLANYAARLYERERDEARAVAVRAAMYATGLPPELALVIDEWRLQQGEQTA